MTLKAALLEELQKLRLSRERPLVKAATKAKSGKTSKDELLKQEADRLVNLLKEGEE